MKNHVRPLYSKRCLYGRKQWNSLPCAVYISSLKFLFHFLIILSLINRLSLSDERMCTTLVNNLEDWACLVKVWLFKLTALDMTRMGWLGRKTSTQTKTVSVKPSRFFRILFSVYFCSVLLKDWVFQIIRIWINNITVVKKGNARLVNNIPEMKDLKKSYISMSMWSNSDNN